MNPVYAQTFARHPRRFLLPLLLTTIVAVWIVLSSGSTYRSTTTLWVDNSVNGQSSLAQDNSVVRPPSAQLQLLLNELLTTRQFRLDVGQKGGMTEYLREHSGNGWGPLALFHALRGSAPLDERVISALNTKNVIATTTGPQVMAIDFDAPTPKLAATTLQALVQELIRQGSVLGVEQRQRDLAYYQQQVDDASRNAQQARGAVSAFLNSHPNAAETNATLASLRHAETAAATALSAAKAALGQVQDTGSVTGGTATLRYVDPPRAPLAANGKKKKILFALIAGLLVGAALSALGVIGFTKFEELGGRVAAYVRNAIAREPTPAKATEAPELAAVPDPVAEAPVEDLADTQVESAAAEEPAVESVAEDPDDDVAMWPVAVQPVDVADPVVEDALEEASQADLSPVSELPSAWEEELKPTPTTESSWTATEPDEDATPVLSAPDPEPEVEAVPTRDSLWWAAEPGDGEAPVSPTPDAEPEEAEPEVTEPTVVAITEHAQNGNGKPEILHEASTDFEAMVVGTIISVLDRRRGRARHPVWTIRTDGQSDSGLREGSRLKMVALPRREGLVREVRADYDGNLLFDYEITRLKLGARDVNGPLALAPTDRGWLGAEVALAPTTNPGDIAQAAAELET